MTDYSQPDFYKFNEDSLRLVRWIESKIIRPSSILDLGAGCGVIGIELANKFHPQVLTLVEAQRDYKEHIETNLKTQLTAVSQINLVIKSFSEWSADRKYDLIVCNPPYFAPGCGQSSKDPRKHLARTFILDGWEVLIDVIQKSLSPMGSAFIVVRGDQLIDQKILKLFKTTEIEHVKFLELS